MSDALNRSNEKDKKNVEIILIEKAAKTTATSNAHKDMNNTEYQNKSDTTQQITSIKPKDDAKKTTTSLARKKVRKRSKSMDHLQNITTKSKIPSKRRRASWTEGVVQWIGWDAFGRKGKHIRHFPATRKEIPPLFSRLLTDTNEIADRTIVAFHVVSNMDYEEFLKDWKLKTTPKVVKKLKKETIASKYYATKPESAQLPQKYKHAYNKNDSVGIYEPEQRATTISKNRRKRSNLFEGEQELPHLNKRFKMIYNRSGYVGIYNKRDRKMKIDRYKLKRAHRLRKPNNYQRPIQDQQMYSTHAKKFLNDTGITYLGIGRMDQKQATTINVTAKHVYTGLNHQNSMTHDYSKSDGYNNIEKPFWPHAPIPIRTSAIPHKSALRMNATTIDNGKTYVQPKYIQHPVQPPPPKFMPSSTLHTSSALPTTIPPSHFKNYESSNIQNYTYDDKFGNTHNAVLNESRPKPSSQLKSNSSVTSSSFRRPPPLLNTVKSSSLMSAPPEQIRPAPSARSGVKSSSALNSRGGAKTSSLELLSDASISYMKTSIAKVPEPAKKVDNQASKSILIESSSIRSDVKLQQTEPSQKSQRSSVTEVSTPYPKNQTSVIPKTTSPPLSLTSSSTSVTIPQHAYIANVKMGKGAIGSFTSLTSPPSQRPLPSPPTSNLNSKLGQDKSTKNKNQASHDKQIFAGPPIIRPPPLPNKILNPSSIQPSLGRSAPFSSSTLNSSIASLTTLAQSSIQKKGVENLSKNETKPLFPSDGPNSATLPTTIPQSTNEHKMIQKVNEQCSQKIKSITGFDTKLRPHHKFNSK